MKRSAAIVLLATLATLAGCSPEPSTAQPQPQPQTEPPIAAAVEPVAAEPAQPSSSANPDLLRQCMLLFDDPSGEVAFQCARYTIMVLPVPAGTDAESLFARRVDEAKAIFEAVDTSGVEIDALPDPPTRAGERAASYRVSFSGPSDRPLTMTIPMVMLLAESDGPTTMVYGLDGRMPTDESFEARLAACTSFVRAMHDADDPKSLVASEEEFMAVHAAKDQPAQTPYQEMFAKLQAITKKACACEPGSACQREAAKEIDAFVREREPGVFPPTSEDNDQLFAELERASKCAGIEF